MRGKGGLGHGDASQGPWQLVGSVVYQASELVSIEFGWRTFKRDHLTGPRASVTFHF